MKRILVIGTTSAIATACARLWANEGAHFFIVGRNAQKLTTVTDDLQARGAQAVHSYVLDLKNVQEYTAMPQAFQQALGQIDIALVAHDRCHRRKIANKRYRLPLRSS